jgi:hypothetical protein
VSRQKAIYEVIHSETGQVLSGHRTRQGAVDTWRVRHSGVPVKIIRWPRRSDGPGVLVVEGIWHESHRPDGADPGDFPNVL